MMFLRKHRIAHTCSQEKQHNCGANARIGGVAYGGYARKVVGRELDRLPGAGAGSRVEDYPEALSASLEEASRLVRGLKQPACGA